MKNFWYLRIGDDTLEEALRFAQKVDAVSEYRRVAKELAQYGQAIDASLHIAPSRAEVVEYPDFVLSLNESGRVVTEQA
jgi:hypothetical protein